MESVRILLILFVFLQVDRVDANDSGRFMLPPSKVYNEPCQREALLLPPGVMVEG
jgi:hypothetical protein